MDQEFIVIWSIVSPARVGFEMVVPTQKRRPNIDRRFKLSSSPITCWNTNCTVRGLVLHLAQGQAGHTSSSIRQGIGEELRRPCCSMCSSTTCPSIWTTSKITSLRLVEAGSSTLRATEQPFGEGAAEGEDQHLERIVKGGHPGISGDDGLRNSLPQKAELTSSCGGGGTAEGIEMR